MQVTIVRYLCRTIGPLFHWEDILSCATCHVLKFKVNIVLMVLHIIIIQNVLHARTWHQQLHALIQLPCPTSAGAPEEPPIGIDLTPSLGIVCPLNYYKWMLLSTPQQYLVVWAFIAVEQVICRLSLWRPQTSWVNEDAITLYCQEYCVLFYISVLKVSTES